MYYLQVRQDGTITDCINYPYGDYTPYSGEVPQCVNGGWFKLIDGEIVEQVELNPNTIDNKIQQAIDEYTLSLIEGGIL
jgi:hypothetical protein